MRKINSIGYGDKILVLISLFLILLPFCCYLISLVFDSNIITIMICISFGVGLLIVISFVVLLTIEFWQDKVINKKYDALKKMKMAIGNGLYECQSCGNRQVKEASSKCGVCGMVFYKERSKEV